MSKNIVKIVLALAIAAAIAAFFVFDLQQYFSLSELKSRRDSLASFSEENPLLAYGGYFGIYVLMAALSLPGAAILTIAAGTIFGLVAGTVLVSFASSIGATLAFLAARFLFRDTIEQRFRERLNRINEGIERDGGFYLFSLRLVPAFPFFVINLVAGLTSLKPLTFYWVSQLGMLPGTIAYVNAGTQLGQVSSVGDILSPSLIGAFVLLAILPFILRWGLAWLKSRRIRRRFDRPASFDYNLVVIGAGSAGLVTAYIAAAINAKVALIERDEMGGECLNTGCVPSKALLKSASLLAAARSSDKLGIRSMRAEFDFRDVMARVHDVIAAIAPHDSVERYEKLGVDCIAGEAKVVSPWEVDVGGRRLTARSLVIATGSRPVVPPIEGLDNIDFLTSDTLWGIEEQPKKLVVLGGGPIGCELTQAFARLGSDVTIVEMGSQLLGREDEDAAGAILESLRERDAVTVALSTKAVRCEGEGASGTLVCERDGEEVRYEFDRLLLALGRKPNAKSAGIEDIGVELADNGTVSVDPYLRTNFPSISVCGDVAGPYQFTHVAAHQAWYASVNSLIRPFWSFRVDYSVIPWCTFTDPEVARVGHNETSARDDGVEFEATTYRIDELDRAITDGVANGFVKVLTPPGKDRILGATIVAAHAGEMIAEFVLAMKHGLGMNDLLGTIHVYPTMMEANKYAAGAWKRANKPERLLGWARRFFALRRA